MPEHTFTVVARGHAVDAQTNCLTLFSVLEQLKGPALPFGLPGLDIVTLWSRRPGEENVAFVQRTRLVAPSGREVFRSDTSFTMDRARHRVLLSVARVPFEESGLYRVEVLVRRQDSEQWSDAVVVYPLEVTVQVPRAEPALLEQQGPPAVV